MKCSLCLKETSVPFLDLGKQPLANKYPRQEDFAKEDFFPEVVYFCLNCKNVQLGTIVSRERMFEDYYYLSSVNPGLVRHFNSLAQKLKDGGSRFVLDVGSNDGILLKPLKELGLKFLGLDPSVNVSKIANDAGLETVTAFFDTKSAQDIKIKYGQPDTIVASSIFTHLDDPHEFMIGVKNLMQADGKFIIEVEYIGNIIKDIAFERFYLDRIFYYSLSSLSQLAKMHNMYISDVEMVEPHGGSLQVTFQNIGFGKPVNSRVSKMLEEENVILTLSKLFDFKKEVDKTVTDFKNKLIELKNSGVKVAGYGCPARVTTITNYGNIGPDLIDFIVDDSPLKQNKFSPGKHIPIVPNNYLQNNKPDLLVVFAFEYMEDIRKKTNNDYRYLIPIPPREVTTNPNLISTKNKTVLGTNELLVKNSCRVVNEINLGELITENVIVTIKTDFKEGGTIISEVVLGLEKN